MLICGGQTLVNFLEKPLQCANISANNFGPIGFIVACCFQLFKCIYVVEISSPWILTLSEICAPNFRIWEAFFFFSLVLHKVVSRTCLGLNIYKNVS